MKTFSFPGEEQAVAMVRQLGSIYGYGNLISHLRDAWSEKLQFEYKLPKEIADESAGHICVWCKVDSRTGKRSNRKAKKCQPKERPTPSHPA